MLNTVMSCFNATVYFLPSYVSGISGFGFRRVLVRSTATYVSASADDVLGKCVMEVKNSVVSATIYLYILGMYDVRQRYWSIYWQI